MIKSILDDLITNVEQYSKNKFNGVFINDGFYIIHVVNILPQFAMNKENIEQVWKCIDLYYNDIAAYNPDTEIVWIDKLS